MRENLVVRDPDGEIRAWGSVHDRAEGRMLFVHVVDRELDERLADACSDVLFEWAEAQARSVGAARGLAVQQIDTGAFADDERQHAWLADAGFDRVRTWWQMSRSVERRRGRAGPRPGAVGAPGRRVPAGRARRATACPPRPTCARSTTCSRGLHRPLQLRRGDLPRVHPPAARGPRPPLGPLVAGRDRRRATATGRAGRRAGRHGQRVEHGPDGSYVSYLGVLESARGRGVATGLLRTIIADAASRRRDRVGLEVDADSPTGADGLYTAMGWGTKYVTESWHRDVPVT